MAAIVFRQAALTDAPEIHALLLSLAREIPLQLDTLEREEALYTLIRTCARSGESWLALAGEPIVAVLLAERSQARRHYAEQELIEIRHVAVAPGYRGRGIFPELLQRVLAQLVPVAISVSLQNRFGMAGRLEKLGFTRVPGSELRFRREP